MLNTLPQSLLNLYNLLVAWMDTNGIQHPDLMALAIIIPLALAMGFKRNF